MDNYSVKIIFGAEDSYPYLYETLQLLNSSGKEILQLIIAINEIDLYQKGLKSDDFIKFTGHDGGGYIFLNKEFLIFTDGDGHLIRLTISVTKALKKALNVIKKYVDEKKKNYIPDKEDDRFLRLRFETVTKEDVNRDNLLFAP